MHHTTPHHSEKTPADGCGRMVGYRTKPSRTTRNARAQTHIYLIAYLRQRAANRKTVPSQEPQEAQPERLHRVLPALEPVPVVPSH